MNELEPQAELVRNITEAIRSIISEVPVSQEPASLHPHVRAQQIAEVASWRAAGVAGGLAIVPGPVGLLTIVPALGEIWRIQRQMVADIAACYGQTVSLTPTVMVYCLFRHGAATVFKETVVQLGGRLLVRQGSLQILERISLSVTQRVVGQFISRWLPLLGSIAIGAYTYRDTKKVATSAIDTFEKEIEAEFTVVP